MQFLLNYLYKYNENRTNVLYLSSLLTAENPFENIKGLQSFCNLKTVNELMSHPI